MTSTTSSHPASAAAPRLAARQVAERLGGTLVGDGAVEIHGVESVADARPGQATFLAHAKAARSWDASSASLALVSRGVLPEEPDPRGRVLVFVDDAEVAMIDLLEAFAPQGPRPAPGVHPAASVGEGVVVGDGACIAEGVTIGARCHIGERVVLHTGVRLYDDVHIGADTTIHANVVIRERCVIGARVTIEPNAVIGADGFGYRPVIAGGAPVRLRKVPQIGIVEIGDDVDIGAGTCIDRAKFGRTLVGQGTKIDNLCQVGHNARIGRHCVIAGQVAIAGSVVIGDWCQVGGGTCIADHLTVGAGARIGGMTAVYKDIPAGATFVGVPGEEAGTTLRQLAALRKLPGLLKGLGGDRDRERGASRPAQPPA